MTNEERDVITRFIERVGGGAPAGAGSVPGSRNLPPVDRDADALIGDLFTRHPEARYRITQLAYVQEQALNAAQQRIQALQQQMQQLQAQGSGGGQGGASPWGQPAQPAQPQSRGFLSSLFGGGSNPPPPQYAPPPYQPPPQYAPQYAAPPAMMQQQGSGFLGGALRTAAGVAGGLVAGEALMSLFEGNRGGGFGGFGSETAMPGGFVPGGEPGWVGGGDPGFAGAGGPAAGFDPGDQGGALKDSPGGDQFASRSADTGGWQDAPPDQGGWQQASDNGGGWQDAPADQGGGWDNASSDDDSGGWTDSSSDA